MKCFDMAAQYEDVSIEDMVFWWGRVLVEIDLLSLRPFMQNGATTNVRRPLWCKTNVNYLFTCIADRSSLWMNKKSVIEITALLHYKCNQKCNSNSAWILSFSLPLHCIFIRICDCAIRQTPPTISYKTCIYVPRYVHDNGVNSM